MRYVSEERIPLSALRPVLDEGADSASWPLDIVGVEGRALVLPAGRQLTFRLILDQPVRFLSAVMLVPREWREGHGSLRATVGVELANSAYRELWSGALPSLRSGGRAEPLRVELELPAGSRTLVLGAERGHDVSLINHVAWSGGELALSRALASEGSFAMPEVGLAAPGAAPEDCGVAPVARLSSGPLISVLTPVHDPPVWMLEEAIESVRAQTYPHWELCLCDDGSSDPKVIATLQRYVEKETRVKLTRHEQAGGIAAATNAALELATGEYIALLDHDDTLTPDALKLVADHIYNQPDLDMIYSDEDVTGEDGRTLALHLKPGWSPDTARTVMYTCHLGVYRRSLAIDIGGFRSEFDGTQDYDFILRLMEHTDRVGHIPRVLYHWRAHVASAAGGDQAKPYAYVLQPQAIAAHLKRSGISGRVDFAGTIQGVHRIVYATDLAADVAVIATMEAGDSAEVAWHLAKSLMNQPLPNWRLILVGPRATVIDAAEAVCAAGTNRRRVDVVEVQPGTDVVAPMSTAGLTSDADLLLLADAPFIGLTHGWLDRLAGYARQSWIAAAGPIVLDGSGRIEQAGIAWSNGVPLHLRHGSDGAAGTPGAFNVIAVSGMLVTPREVFQRLDGLRVEFGNLALIDYCLRAGRGDLRSVIVPDVRVRDTGRDRTWNDIAAMRHLRAAWGGVLRNDPYYNPWYAADRGDYAPAGPETGIAGAAIPARTRGERSARAASADALNA
jgi:GT2 family glycosyltransferase